MYRLTIQSLKRDDWCLGGPPERTCFVYDVVDKIGFVHLVLIYCFYITGLCYIY